MQKLYEQDAYLRSFFGTVVSCKQGKKGWDIVLDQTAFYPEGGGQPYDIGTLGGVNVLEVHERDGKVVHTCDGPLAVDAWVEGDIDWARRFDLMQHHSGEHIVSGIAHSKWGCDNVGFHMGSEVITIDLNREFTEEELQELEDAVNQYIWSDEEVDIFYPLPEMLNELEYRSKKAIEGQVRIVSFPGADTCACCGTHVSSAGQVGLVKLLSCVKFREGVRIELVCGNRALKYLSALHAQNKKLTSLLSAKPFETAQAVERLLAENDALKLKVQELENAHFAALAQKYAGSGTLVLFEDGLAPDALRRLCDAISQKRDGLCACFSGTEAAGYKYALAHRGGDLRSFSKALNADLHGRGGGKPDFVQGSVSAKRAEIEGYLAQHAQ